MEENWKSRLYQFLRFFRKTPFQAGLFEILAEMREIESREDRATWLEHLGRWLSKDSDSPQRYVRFKFLFHQLDKDSSLRAQFTNQIRLHFDGVLLLRFLLQTGFAEQTGLLMEIGTRFLSSILPTVRDNDFFEISREVIRSEKELSWFRQMPKESLEQLIRLFSEKESSGIRLTLGATASEALLVISARLASFGLASEIRTRANHVLPSESPFLKLQIEIRNVLEKGPGSQSLDNGLVALLSACHGLIAHVYADMEQNGTSVGLVYRLEAMTAALDRIRQLLDILKPLNEALDLQRVHALFASAAEGTYQGQSIIGHVHQQTHLLSRKIAERNGESGDHYIARDKSERRLLFVSALKGGAIVVVMTAMKMTLHSWHLPALFEALLIWFIYSLGFLVMQFTDSTLATKLPSFTASKLARMMASARQSAGFHSMASELREVVVSQTLAFVGNLIMVIPLAMALEAAVSWAFGGHVLALHQAHQTLEGLHPFTSLAVFFGIMTGLFLWLSSLAGGWFENWIVFRKIPLAIQSHKRFNRVFGKIFSAKVANWIEHNASGISANITLGFLFGFAPFLGFVTGLPLDSRHVTISSASAALASLTIEPSDHLFSMLLWSALGLVLIGLANLLVSFSLALIVAARASEIDSRRFKILLSMLGRRLIGLKTRKNVGP